MAVTVAARADNHQYRVRRQNSLLYSVPSAAMLCFRAQQPRETAEPFKAISEY